MEHVLGRVRRSKDDLSKLCNSEELVLTMHHLSSESARTNLAVSFCFIEHGSISGRHFVFCCFCFAKFLARMETKRHAFRAEFLPRYVRFLPLVDFASRLKREEEVGNHFYERFYYIIEINLSRKLTLLSTIFSTLLNTTNILIVEISRCRFTLTLETSDNRRKRH